ncbi:helix-turn-helix domain-containing protein [Spirosoma panaciterrae]|uniref:helix-turn-helix domain-containing protein n=1 Tax=Spirosoma panaciterrae TaxID=496058 RepID=UPI00036F7295|nr:AraC family transcriptional regulator [Spirosoma panaciterrae]
MRPVFEQISTGATCSFLVRRFEATQFWGSYHFHPEFELTLILKGEGQRYVGKHVANFEAGDLVLLGSNLPHCWKTLPTDDQQAVGAIVVQFGDDFWGSDFGSLPEMRPIKSLLEKAQAGLQIRGDSRQRIAEQMQQLVTQTALQRLLTLLDMLGELTGSEDVYPLDMAFPDYQHKPAETLRFQRVFAYLIDHFREDITLDDMAQVAHLSPTSFCRYIKTITQKTFVELLITFRLRYACQLLVHSELPIQQVAFESGFGDVPYFNKVFKKQQGRSPLAYRRSHQAG